MPGCPPRKHPATTLWLPLLCLLLAMPGGCRRHAAPLRMEWLSMGTLAAVQCADHDSAAAVRATTRQIYDALEAEVSLWRPDSLLSQVNQRAGTPAVTPISPDFLALLEQSCAYHAASAGAFNPLIGSVMRVWGFNQGTVPTVPPPAAVIAEALALTHPHDILLERHDPQAPTLRLAKPGMLLDLGAIAKGYAVDLAWEHLRAAGYDNLLLDLGGNLRALGLPRASATGWHTGIRHPTKPATLIGSFLLRATEATATSGNYERFVTIDGQRYPHILDGRTGWPAQSIASVTVVAPDATTADALSTILFILGPVAGQQYLKHHPDCDAFWLDPQDSQLRASCTPGFQKRLRHLDKTLIPTILPE